MLSQSADISKDFEPNFVQPRAESFKTSYSINWIGRDGSVIRFGVLAVFAWIAGLVTESTAQRPRFPDPFQLQTGSITNAPTTATRQIPGQPTSRGAVIQLPSVFNSPPSITTTPPPSTFATPGFDPYQRPANHTPNNVYLQVTHPQSVSNGNPTFQVSQQQQFQILPPETNLTPVAPPGTGGVQPPYFTDPPYYTPPPEFQQPQYGVGAAPYDTNPSRWPSSSSAWPSQMWARMRDDYLPRLLERPRFRYTFIPGSDDDQVQVNEFDIATTLTLPRFFNSKEPFRLTPGFVLSLWDGPNTMATGYELPNEVYSAFLALDHVTDTSLRWGWETNLTLGVYSEFGVYNTDSLRLTGLGLLWFRINEINTFKIGVEYLDRVKTKMLPAFGVFIMPTPDVKMDIYFPRPRIAQRMPKFYNYETWSYVGAEYGGGSWTVDRSIAGFVDQVDMNDVRAFVGVEWMGPRGVTGFFECGYVFDRELVYASGIPTPSLPLKDAFMLRTGIAF